RPLLDDGLRLACVRGKTERAAAAQNRDRRGRHPLHSRQVPAPERVAADHHARLARFGDRTARGRRPADGPDRARRARGGRGRPGAALFARVRLLPRAGRSPRARRPPPGGPGAAAWAELMHRLGYTHYVAQGGDVGAAVTDAMGRQAPDGLLGIHMNLLVAGLAGGYPSADPSAQERAALDAIATFRTSGN